MKSLCYMLALSAVLSAADNLNSQNGSSVQSKLESRKIKHTISRVYSFPQNSENPAHNNEHYNQILKLIKHQGSQNQEINASEINKESNDVDTEASEIQKSVKEISTIQNGTSNDDLTDINKFLYKTNENGKKERDIDNIISMKETELNSATLNEIIQNLKASNVSNFGHKPIRKGKLVIYYDNDEEASEMPIGTNAHTKHKKLDVDKLSQFDEEIYNLFTHYKVPDNIFYTIKRPGNIESKERTNNLITAFVKYMVDKGQISLEVINKLQNIIADNNVDINLSKILESLNDSSDTEDHKTEIKLDDGANYSENISGDLEHTTEQSKDNYNKSEFFDLPVDNSFSTEHKSNNYHNEDRIIVPNIEQVTINVEKNNDDEINPESSESGDAMMDLNIEELLQTALQNNQNVKNNFSLDMLSIETPDPINYENNKDDKIKKSEDTYNAILSRLIEKSMQNCDLYDDCETDKNVYSFNHDALKMILNRAIPGLHIPQIQQVESNVPVFSNIPADEFLNYNNKKPFFIYVMFSDREGYNNPTHMDPLFKIPDDITKSNFEKLIPILLEKDKMSSILHLIKYLNKIIGHRQELQSRIVKPLPFLYSSEDILDIISKPKPNSKSNTGQSIYNYRSTSSENELIDKILRNFINNKKSTTKLYEKDPTLEILYNLSKIFDLYKIDKSKDDEILNLNSDINNEPEYKSARNGSEKNTIERLRKLFLNAENYSAEKIPDIEDLRKITQDPYALKIIIHQILQDERFITSQMKLKKEQKGIHHSTEELVEQMNFLRNLLEKRNIPQHIGKKLIKEEFEKGILKIFTESVTNCTNEARKTIELSFLKALQI